MTRRNTPQVRTFGCRLNIWESEVLREQAGAAGLSDAIIFNTCAVTSEATASFTGPTRNTILSFNNLE